MAHYDNYSNRGNMTNLSRVVGSKWRKELLLKMINRLGYELDGPIKVLEVGGGKGEFATILVNSGYEFEYSGIEPNENLAEVLSQFGSVSIGFSPPINEPDSSFDIVYSSNVIEHVSDDTIAEFASEMSRVLKPGGVMVIQAPNYLDMKEMFWDCDYTHKSPMTPIRFQQIATDLELKILDIEKMRFGQLGLATIPVFFINRLLRQVVKLKTLNSSSKIYKAYLSSSQQLLLYATK